VLDYLNIPDHDPIGIRVARLRRRRGLTRPEFADLCGRSVSWVDKIERGERGLVRLPVLEQVAGVLHVPIEALTDSPGRASGARSCLDAFEVDAVRAAMQSYGAFTQTFRPALLGATQAAVFAHSGTDDTAIAARTLLSQTYQVTASVLWKLMEIDLAWLAAERALVLAESTEDSHLISDAARRVAQGLMTTGHHDDALCLVYADINRLEPGQGNGSAEFLSLYGMSFLLGAVVAARASQGAAARALLREGAQVAAQLGGDRNERFTSFGPTNVLLHTVAALVDLHDGTAAIDIAKSVHPDLLSRLPKERRANFHLDVARGHLQRGHRAAALDALLQAQAVAPNEVRCRPVGLGLVSDLQQRWIGTPPWSLRQLAGQTRTPSGA